MMLFDALLSLGSTIADKLFPDADKKLETKQQKEKFEQLYRMALLEEASKENSEFRKFMLEYEGRLIDIPRPVQYLRSSVRPVITYAVTGAYIYTFLHPENFTPQQLAMLNTLLLLVNAFWFGEKLITRTGFLEIFRKKEDSGG
jgi:chromosome condensin MukBEF MukE localization factor